jgi:N-acetyllactosaminide beta-1,3-N-acetylglucosaminyltransferase
MFFFKASSWERLSKSRQVCFGSQTSLDRLYWLTKTIEVWSGPISIALFAPDIEYFYSATFINHYLYRCHPKVQDRVAFHITYNVEHPPIVIPDQVKADHIVGLVRNYSCSSDPETLVNTLMQNRSKEMLDWREDLAYPQNHLRNVAKAGCQTNFSFIPDMDMIPIPGMDLDLDKFFSEPAQQNCTMCAYVIPTYEISMSNDHLPVNKTELIQFLKKGRARPFHIAIYRINQKSSNLRRWQKIPQSNELKVAFQVEKYIFKYEPLYVSRADVPSFDERFIGFGMTRNSQVKSHKSF